MKNRLYDVKTAFYNKTIMDANFTCPTGQTKFHHNIVSLLLHGHTNLSVTDISCSWSKRPVKAIEEVTTIFVVAIIFKLFLIVKN
ncbi:Hypothetical protein CINCED_3A010882 [Cinara cedri]|nr:Hypothetical protein CINCED_3A010882 [Cinara cedri]